MHVASVQLKGPFFAIACMYAASIRPKGPCLFKSACVHITSVQPKGPVCLQVHARS